MCGKHRLYWFGLALDALDQPLAGEHADFVQRQVDGRERGIRKRGILEIRDRTLRVLNEGELHRIANAKDSEAATLDTK